MGDRGNGGSGIGESAIGRFENWVIGGSGIAAMADQALGPNAFPNYWDMAEREIGVLGIDDWVIGRSGIQGLGIVKSVNRRISQLQNRGQGIERSGIGRLRIGIWRDQVFGMDSLR